MVSSRWKENEESIRDRTGEVDHGIPKVGDIVRRGSVLIRRVERDAAWAARDDAGPDLDGEKNKADKQKSKT